MSGYAMEWAAEAAKAKGLDPTARWVLVAMAYHASAKWGRCYAGAEQIAETAGCSRRTVLAAMDRIRESGVVDVTIRAGQTAIWVFPTPPRKNLHGSVAFVPVDTTGENGNPCNLRPEPVQDLHGGGAKSAPEQVINKFEQESAFASLAKATEGAYCQPPPSTWHPSMPPTVNLSADPDDHIGDIGDPNDRVAKADYTAVMLEMSRRALRGEMP